MVVTPLSAVRPVDAAGFVAAGSLGVGATVQTRAAGGRSEGRPAAATSGSVLPPASARNRATLEAVMKPAVVQQLAAAALELGHQLQFLVRIEGGKFVMRCSCGWEGKPRGDGRHRVGGSTRAAMVGEAVEHLAL